MKLFSSETRVNLRTHTKARFVREGSETLVLSILDEDTGVHDEPIVINGSRTMLDKLCASVPPSMPSWEPADDGIPLECPTRSVDAWWDQLASGITDNAAVVVVFPES